MATLPQDNAVISKYYSAAVSELLDNASVLVDAVGTVTIRFNSSEDELAATIRYGDIYGAVKERILENIIRDIHSDVFK